YIYHLNQPDTLPISIIRYMLTKPLDFTPGTRFAYSNLGYNILGRVIEKVSSKTYEEYVMMNILDPLEITDMSLGCNAYQNKQARSEEHTSELQSRLD